ncbi:TorD/DmsD family molecular chaperone [Halopiger aswanensis]|uniref:Nitrate reductase delta subunit n=1 Tax=Halopiger aswanensis TaxID=148449 RepID=A0A3R7HY70_9EURY|nr:molecular chaperone TorD family protein [Halopiger aswanensis]RKD95587.1 nitrate reductase delta subunit [Halopiger aswanensis]
MSMDMEAVYAARLDLVEFLITATHDAPPEEFLEDVLSGDVASPSGSVNDDLDTGFDLLEQFIDQNRDRPLEEVADELEVEYTRLFVGPRPPVIPHETYHREDTDYLGDGLPKVEASYGAAGWSPPEDYPEENDHVAVELAFLRYLVRSQYQGREETLGYQRVFHEEHLSHWIDDCAASIVEEADEPFYEAVGHLLAGYAAFEEEIALQVS